MRWTTLLCLLLWAGPAGGQPDPSPGSLHSPDATTRARAAAHAGATGDVGAVPRLISLLRDSDWRVRLAAVQALERLEAKAALRQLMVTAQADQRPEVRHAAARAVRKLDLRRFVSGLSTSDPPPVMPDAGADEEAGSAGHPAPPPRALLVAVGLATNALRLTDTLSGQVGAGVRWPHLELQVTLGFPSMTVDARARWSFLARGWVLPYATLGLSLSYNNGTDRGPAVSLLGGGGLRVGPLREAGAERRTFWRRCYAYLEVNLSWVFAQRTPRGLNAEERIIALPIMLGVGAELWP